MCHGIGCPAGGCVLFVSLQILCEYIAASYCWPSLNVSRYRLSHLRVHSFLCHCSFRITVLSHPRILHGQSAKCTWSVHYFCISTLLLPVIGPRSWELWMQKLESRVLWTQRSKVLPFKPGAGLCVALHAMPAARDFFFANVYPSGPFTCIFFLNLPEFLLCLLWLTRAPVWACRIK